MEQTTQLDYAEATKSAVRHLMTALGPLLILYGSVQPTDASVLVTYLPEVVGSVVTLVGLAWGVLSKRSPA